jgi:DNA-binding NarL/FixJ family response regulator
VAGIDSMDWQPIVPDEAGAACDCSFDVSQSAEGGGVVESLRFLDPSEDASRYVGGPLSAFLEALGSTVARAVRAALEGRTSEFAHVLVPEGDRAFLAITSRVVDRATVRVTVRSLDSRLLPELVDAKVLAIAAARGLSERERQVLRLLLRGRGVEDIATMLEIAPRTVKFHQANVLQKLGADSRQDLLRVVL